MLNNLCNIEDDGNEKAGTTVREMSPDIVAGTVRKPFDVELLYDMVMACASVRDLVQRDDCPPPDSSHDAQRSKRGDVN